MPGVEDHCSVLGMKTQRNCLDFSCLRLKIIAYCWARKLKGNCLDFMPEVEDHCLVLGMKSQNNCLDFMPEVEEYCVVLGVETQRKLPSFYARG